MQRMFLRIVGVALALGGLVLALAWNPMTCVSSVPVCPTPFPGSAPCGPPVTSCSSDFVLLRVAIALASLGLGVVLVVLPSRTSCAQPSCT